MLTIKMIREDKSEWIEEARSVAYNTAKQSASGSPSITYFTKKADEAVTTHDIYSGQVYVMNENGKTIGDYFLGWPIQETENL